MALPNPEMRHLLARTGFGMARPEEIDALSGRSYAQAVDRLLDGVATKPFTTPPDWLNVPLFAQLEANLPKDRRDAMQMERRENGREMKAWWWAEMLNTPSPMTEHMVLFWHNHFTSALNKVSRPELMYRQTELFRKVALGNFEKLVKASAKDPAMLVYLDTNSNKAGAPNENFARELMELFTLGEGRGYTEQDVREAARAFTGWRVVTGNTSASGWRVDGLLHDGGSKKFMGRTGRFDGDDIIDIILQQPQVAEFVTEKLWHDLVSDPADRVEVQRLAKAFRDSKYELKPLVRAILLSDAFRDPQNRGSLVKSPTDLIVGTFRVIGTPPANPSLFAAAGRALGQDLLDPPNVKGWPGGLSWIDTSLLPVRNAFMNGVAAGVEVQVTGKQTLATQARRDMKNLPVQALDADRLKKMSALPDAELAALLLPVAPVAKINGVGGKLGALLLDPTYNLK
ncbi:MAG: DUF1800 domain-containing protein [Alphaproteobacteria bacterium]|nr:DUF1800 domain-containing protein [Alphaproteobacteria bacterium]